MPHIQEQGDTLGSRVSKFDLQIKNPNQILKLLCD